MEVYILPLSRSQKRLWYQEIINPDNNAFNIPIALRLHGELNQLALENAFQTIIRRHEILRTSFATEDGEPVQIIYPEIEFTLESKILESESELVTESRKPFNLVKGSLIRAILYKIQPQEHILFVNMHHIISDGWSLGVFFKELCLCYNAYISGAEISLPELPIQYGDYAEWQENWLQEPEIKNQFEYWKTQLADLPPALNLPLDYSRPIQQTWNGATVRTQIPHKVYQSLEELARSEGATFFMVALALFQVLLFRYSGQTDIIVGSPIANRRQSELDNLIGFFVNTLALRGDMEGNPSLRELLRRVRKTCLEAYAHQDVPFETLVEQLEAKRDPSRSPIFQTLFALQNAPLDSIQLSGLTVNPIFLDNGGAKFDLTLMLEPSGSNWSAILEYNTDLFTPQTAQFILKHYCQLLASAVADPNVGINTLPLLDENERQELISKGVATAPINEQTANENIVSLFAKTAHTYSDAIAVKYQDQELTYFELDERSNQLAYFLREQGVGKEIRVGIFLNRSHELIVSLLAVLKAGGTYVPLDPAYPSERINFILEDSGISILLTEKALLSSVNTTSQQVVTLEDIKDTAQNHVETLHVTSLHSSQAAYIIYTSGSTGKPKGCVVTHSNVTRLMRSTESWFNFNENDVWTLFHSFAFDFSVWEIWGALLYGGKLVVVDYLESRSTAEFRELLYQEGVTVLNQTPSAFRQLIRADQETDNFLGLRVVIFGGEALELQSLRPWFERYGDEQPRLINMYGITETTVHVTYRPITLLDIQQNRGSVIGVPIPDLSLYILDESLQPTPLGAPGEIYVGGMGVSRGYLNRPELTAQRFIPDPYSSTGARIYRTGDIARRLPNGDIEYLGRSDHQVKVRGFRIELGEIESALVSIPEVTEAVVLTHGDEADKRLVAYIVASNKFVERSYLRNVLKQHLPEYMIPSAFLFLDVIPLTNQGKINRAALLAQDWSDFTTQRLLVLPQTPAEKVICQVWETVLGIDAVSVEDNFFELGGDSILALKVVAELRRQNLMLSPKDIFRLQTVRELAGAAKQLQSEVTSIEKAVGEAPLSPIQNWFFELNIPNPHHWNQAVLLQVNKFFDSQIIQQALNTVVAHHDIFRVRFYQEEGVWHQFYNENESAFGFEIVDLTLLDEIQQNATIKETCARLQQSLDLNNGPLARAALFKGKIGKYPDQLFIVFHHLIIDGVSWRILLEDIAGAMSYISAGKPVILSQRTSSFKHWSEFLNSIAKSPAIESEKQFWLNMLESSQSKLPLDFSNPTLQLQNIESSVKTSSVFLTQVETDILLTKANKAYHTQPQELLLAAVAKTISKITTDNKVKIIMEGHGREDISSELDITRTIGWFTTLYPLCLNLPSSTVDSLSTQNLITSVKEQARSVPQHGLGYGILRYLQDSNTELVHSPADISFNYLGQVRNQTGDNNFFNLLNEDTQPSHDPNGLRPHLIDIICIVVEGQLRVDWLYSTNLHLEETIVKWSVEFRQNLLEILAHCTQPGVGTYTESDFPLVCLNQSRLSQLQTQYPNLEDIYPLSPLQEGMLFHSVYAPDDSVYFEQVTGKITGQLDTSAFAVAWQSVVDRHQILRSAFVWEQEVPIQVVNNSVEFTILEKDWRHLSQAEQLAQLDSYLASDRKQGFDLGKALLMRFVIIRLDEYNWQWIWSHHHILLDGWSISIIFKEVLEIYHSQLQGVQHNLSPIIPYRAYIQWLAERNYEDAEEFWRSQLAGISEPTLISWKPQENIETSTHNKNDYEAIELRLSDEDFANLLNMAQNHRLTLNTLAQAAWALLLQKYGAARNECNDVLFGATVSGRIPEIVGVENMIGLFINTLPMRISLNPSVTVKDWLEEIQQRQVQMQEYQYSKLTDIRDSIEFPAGESLFESILVFENYPTDQSLKNQGKGIEVSHIEFHEKTNYPLTVAFIPDTGLLLKLNYETQLLSDEAAKTMLQRLQYLLLELAKNPEVLLGEIALVENLSPDPSEFNWKDFHAAHQLFERQADLDPNATALVFGANSITYGELERKSNILANILKSKGVSYESLVGLYFEPSIDFIVALLAVLKAGGAFLPLDIAHPEERLQVILEDSQVSLILATEAIAFKHNHESHQVISLSEIDWTQHNTSRRLNLNINSSHLAYVIYTSGSTGKPKGVLVTHAGVQNLVEAQTTTFGVTKQSRIYQFASLNFDAAVSEIFMALGSGATLYMAPASNRFPGSELWSTLTAWKITHLTLVPSVLATIKPEELPTLETLIVAGEAASGNILRRWGKQCRVFNAYGPTEATVCASMMDCSNLIGEPSIGQGMKNSKIYLLNEYFQPVPPGIPGEIYIDAIGLARGYLNRPELTASAFIPHPFAKEPGTRLYRTGDTGVYDSNGHIYFLGRQDNRVKLHGYRIELGEIEAALVKNPAVNSAVVLLREDTPGRPRLVAYVITSTVEVTSHSLLDDLSQVLPSYMLPSAIVFVKEWSLTPNGKIDRKALKAPEIPTVQLSTVAASETEKILCKIWAEVLGIETVNPNDNFFEMGGDSIITLQIVSRAREAGLDISPKDIFETKTLASLAARAKALRTSSIEVDSANSGKVPLAPIQHWFFERNLPHSHQWNQIVAVSTNQLLDINVFATALETVVAHHDAFRLRYEAPDGIWQQSYTDSAPIKLRIEDFSSYCKSEQEKVLADIAEQEQALINLNNSPLLRVVYAKNLEEHGDVIIFFAHHLIIDGVSWRIIFEDLNQAYHQAEKGKFISLPAKSSSYRQWTTSLEKLANSPIIEKDLQFWQTQSYPTTLPLDNIGNGANTVESLVIESSQLSAQETSSLLLEATVAYHAGVQEILLAALLKTFTENHESNILIDLEGHGREDLGSELDITKTVGWFTSLYPVVLQKPQENQLENYLKEVKNQIRAIPHHGISYGLLRYLNKNQITRETLANLHKPQISFNYLGQIDNQNSNNLFSLSNVPTGSGMFGKQERPHLLAVNARIQDERLFVDWSYSKNIHGAQTIKNLAENYLRNLGAYLVNPASCYTSSDFNLVELTDSELDSLLEDLE
ncbi:hypothetical protein DSM106972_091740 [Dulcicalothrix desertica PCC 7102]|uniref:Carrier domain-containing protein n=1 Tax=Dulcicalothrix desertica PCC 7102 TaxID=232991 RepID=A0A3S1C0X3_9CYAN|nr:non-ribosomal peptide synthetase [Dulcicalothrix desertica]RUS95014.1 hypothetical protein DSM106972_091740 [Dulcicalothrix desertica PCC 7102]TWH51410.1 non-ribosomal peptide synthase protein (TIGR01720 family)/amino acid adenylation domain-containing protein [Dulcicalothrix desertica PCC 7102]